MVTKLDIPNEKSVVKLKAGTVVVGNYELPSDMIVVVAERGNTDYDNNRRMALDENGRFLFYLHGKYTIEGNLWCAKKQLPQDANLSKLSSIFIEEDN